MAGNTGILREERSLAHLGSDTAEAVDELGGGGDTTLVSGGVDGGNSGIDNGVLSSNLLQGNELLDEGTGVVSILKAGTDGLNSDMELLSAEVGIDNLVPARGELLKVGDSRRKLVELAKPAITLLLDVLLDVLGELALELDSLLKETVVELLLGNLALAVLDQVNLLVVALLEADHLLLELATPSSLLSGHRGLNAGDKVVGGLVETINASLDRLSSLSLNLGLHLVDPAGNLGELIFGLADGRSVLLVGVVVVDNGNDVVQHVDEILNNGVGGTVNLERVNGRGRGPARRLVNLGSLEGLLGGGGSGSNGDSRIGDGDGGGGSGLNRSNGGGGLGLGKLSINLLGTSNNGVLGLGDGILDVILSGNGSLLDRARLTTGRLTTIGNAPRGTALGGDLDLLTGVARTTGYPADNIGEALLEIELLQVQNSLLAIGDVLGEEVVEGVVDARVVDTTTEGDSAKDGERQEEVAQSAEEALLLAGSRESRRDNGLLGDGRDDGSVGRGGRQGSGLGSDSGRGLDLGRGGRRSGGRSQGLGGREDGGLSGLRDNGLLVVGEEALYGSKVVGVSFGMVGDGGM